MSTVHIEQLLHIPVLDSNDKKVGHIEEIVADIENGELLVREYHTGAPGLLEHLAGITMGAWLPRLIRRHTKEYIIAWDQLDLTDPSRPRVTVPRSQLKERRP